MTREIYDQSRIDNILKKTFNPQPLPAPTSNVFRLLPTGHDVDPVAIMGYRANHNYYPQYYYRRNTVDEKIKSFFINKEPVLLVTGNPLAGKSRAVLEILKEIVNWQILLITDLNNLSLPLILPSNINPAQTVVFFDDIDNNYIQHKDITNALLKLLLEQKIKILATCRTGPEYARLRVSLDRDMNLLFLDPNNMVEIQKIDIQQLKKAFDGSAVPKLDWNSFDGNIGSIFLDLQTMRSRFDKLKTSKNPEDLLAVTILLGLKCHYHQQNFEINKSTYFSSKIKEFCKRYQKIDNIFISIWLDAIEKINSTQTDLNFIVDNGDYINTEEVYLDNNKKVVWPALNTQSINSLINQLYPNDLDKKNAGFPYSVGYFTDQIINTTSFDDCKLFLQMALALGTLLDISTYNILMNKAPSYEETREILDKEMKAASVKPNIVTYDTLMKKAPSYEIARAILDKEMKTASVKPDEITYSTLMDKAPSYEIARAILDKEMKTASVKPDEITYSTLMDKAPSYEIARVILDKEMKAASVKPNVVTYSTLMDKAPSYEIARVILDKEMKAASVTPDVVTYNTLMDKAPSYEIARAILDKEMKAASVTPNIVTYNTLMDKASSYEIAHAILDKEMKAASVTPDIVTYDTLMDKAPSYEIAREILDKEMKAASVKPDEITYGTLMKKAPSYEIAREILDKEMKAASIKPDEITYGTLMKKAPSYEIAREILDKEMKAASVKPNEVIYSMLVDKAPSFNIALSVCHEILGEANGFSVLKPINKKG